MSKVMNKLVGESERKIDHALQVAQACAPCILLFDEVEKCLVGNSQSDGGVTNRILQSILKFMNDNDSGVYVVMTSNDVSQLPPEFTRAGRLDATWYFGLPNATEREAIFKVHFGHKNKTVGDVILKRAVAATKGYTGAEIQQVVKNTMIKAFQRYKEDGNANITVDDVVAAAAEVIPVSQSSREKIAALENYCRTRARFASGTVDTPQKEQEEESDEEGFLLDLN
jgi:SpoVK/Ycf46/Vps4 family AAA+-type ATPase